MGLAWARWARTTGLFAGGIAAAVACSSSSHPAPTTTTGNDSGPVPDTNVVFDAVQTSDAPYVKCGTETCQRGDICITDQENGGAVTFPNDAGECPDGDYLPDGAAGGGGCAHDPTYHCTGLPSACNGVLACACAQSLCDPGYMCSGATGLVLSCVLDAP